MKATMMEEQVVAVLEQDNQQIKREMLERAKENVTRILRVAFALTGGGGLMSVAYVARRAADWPGSRRQQ